MKYLSQKYTVREASFFKRTEVPRKVQVGILYYWREKIKNCQILSMMKSYVTRVNIIDYFNFFRDISSTYLLTNRVLLGGQRDIVEIDETHLGAKPKYACGRRRQQKAKMADSLLT